MIRSLIVALALAIGAGTSVAWAVDPSEMLKDPKLEHRAEELGKELRCLVCQSESIEESNADLARDLRVIVRERIAAGQTDEQVRQFVVDRYGDYVLLKPPFKLSTVVLWLGPFLFFAVGLGVVILFYRRRPSADTTPPVPLSADEKKRIEALLKDTGK